MSFGIREFYAEKSLTLSIGDKREFALYDCGDTVPVDVVPHSETAVSGSIKVTLDDNAGNLSEQIFEAGSPIRFEVARPEPGFVNILADWTIDGKSVAKLERAIGFSVNKIRPFEPEPADFVSFWQGLFADADALPDPVRLIPVPDRETETTRLFELHVPTLNDRTIYGYVSVPKGGKKYPVLTCFPGSGPAGGEQQWLRYDDAITLLMNVHSYPYRAGETKEETIARAGYDAFDYATIGIESRDTYVYHDVLPAMHRAITFIQTLPEYDGRNLGVFGSSQGGWLSIMTAAFHPEIKAVCANVPAFTQLDGFMAVRHEMAKHEDN
ncbi:MAG: acetylxylan esterase, partial [Lentisphaeria bacterium]|nr:acetylxylan esterase [Lentisphaeria bacterium]